MKEFEFTPSLLERNFIKTTMAFPYVVKEYIDGLDLAIELRPNGDIKLVGDARAEGLGIMFFNRPWFKKLRAFHKIRHKLIRANNPVRLYGKMLTREVTTKGAGRIYYNNQVPEFILEYMTNSFDCVISQAATIAFNKTIGIPFNEPIWSAPLAELVNKKEKDLFSVQGLQSRLAFKMGSEDVKAKGYYLIRDAFHRKPEGHILVKRLMKYNSQNTPDLLSDVLTWMHSVIHMKSFLLQNQGESDINKLTGEYLSEMYRLYNKTNNVNVREMFGDDWQIANREIEASVKNRIFDLVK